MGTPMQNQARYVLNAVDEGRVGAVITLYDAKMLGSDPALTRRQNIRNYLTHDEKGLGMSEENADYWLDWFTVTV